MNVMVKSSEKLKGAVNSPQTEDWEAKCRVNQGLGEDNSSGTPAKVAIVVLQRNHKRSTQRKAKFLGQD